jgi:hypothetical protein
MRRITLACAQSDGARQCAGCCQGPYFCKRSLAAHHHEGFSSLHAPEEGEWVALDLLLH